MPTDRNGGISRLSAASAVLPVLRSLSTDQDAVRALGQQTDQAWAEIGAADRHAVAAFQAEASTSLRDAKAGVRGLVDPRVALVDTVLAAFADDDDPLDRLGRAIQGYVEQAEQALPGIAGTLLARQFERLLQIAEDSITNVSGEHPQPLDAKRIRWRSFNAGENLDRCLLLSEVLQLSEQGYFELSLSAIRRAVQMLDGNPHLVRNRAIVDEALEATRDAIERASATEGLMLLANRVVGTLPRNERDWDASSMVMVGIHGLLGEIAGTPADIEAVGAARGVAYELASGSEASPPINQVNYPWVLDPQVIREVWAEENDLKHARLSAASTD